MAEVSITIDGRPVNVPAGTTVAAGIVQQNMTSFRHSVTGQPRAPLCGMGICFECRVTLDGEAQRLSCQTACAAGMDIRTKSFPVRSASEGSTPILCSPSGVAKEYDIIVIGGGPAGLAAASAAALHRRVLLLDDNPTWGGQIWRGEEAQPSTRVASQQFQQAAAANVDFLAGARVFAQPAPNRLSIEQAEGCQAYTYKRLILAPGARERFLPFPGWTLPGVMGAGGLQALVKGGLPIAGKTVVVAGSGPLLLAVASYLKKRGAVVRLVAEQASWSNLLRFGFDLVRHPRKLLQALGLKWQLRGTPFVQAVGQSKPMERIAWKVFP